VISCKSRGQNGTLSQYRTKIAEQKKPFDTLMATQGPINGGPQIIYK
jgi:hypothetical protein